MEMKTFYINFTESRGMKIDVWKEEIKLDLGKKEVDSWYKQNNWGYYNPPNCNNGETSWIDISEG